MANSMLVLISVLISSGLGEARDSSLLAGQDLHVSAATMVSCADPTPEWDQVLLMDDGVSIQVGDNLLGSKSAVVWLRKQGGEQAEFGTGISYVARVYLEGNITVQQGQQAKSTSMMHFDVSGAEVLLAEFRVTGQVFAVTDEKTQIERDFLTDYELYSRASEAAQAIPSGPTLPAESMVPDPARVAASPAGSPEKAPKLPDAVARQLKESEAAAQKELAPKTEKTQAAEPPTEVFPVHVSAVWEPAPMIERIALPDGTQAVTASGRFYVWQKRSADQTIEFMADNLVLFLGSAPFALEPKKDNSQIGSGAVDSVYLSGNIVMTEGPRTTRADEIYYDFVNQRALVINASMRMFDEGRQIPIYLRAKQIGRVSKDIFEAQDITLTNSEFYFPQISVTASKMVLLTGEALQQRQRLAERADQKAKMEGQLYDVRAKAGDFSIFKWSRLTTDFQRPDLPISRIRFGSDSEFGTSIETQWYLTRLLGMTEPEWLKSRLNVDYYSKRGPGAGVDAEYETDKAYGELISYIIDDHGEDDLGRIASRRNLEPEQDLRGRFSFRHHEYLPDDWQLTLEVSYLSDRNFLEWLYRNDFYTEKEQETLVYLKKIKDNWGFSILGKMRINDFQTTTEELPSIEYHRTGQSFWNDQFTFYSDTQVARFRNRYDDDAVLGPQQTSNFYTFASTRNEIDLPLSLETFKLVPFAAASYGYEDNYGWEQDLFGRSLAGEDQVVLGEFGLRGATMFWKDDPYARSEFWDVRGIRHIVTPYFETVNYNANDSAADMRDVTHVGVLQRWQTHRGSEENIRTLDWMRLNVEATWVKDDASSSIGPANTYGPAAFVYNDPSIPLLLRRDESFYGMARDTITGEYIWRLSDTMSMLSDINYDMNSGHLQQLNIGVSRFVYPDLSYYIGSRYLRPILVEIDENDDGVLDISEKGSHSFVTAVSYRINPRYVASFSQEYNFDFGKAIRSDFSLLRQYHRLYYALSFSFDESLKRNSVMVSIWPQGVDELAIGSRRYVDVVGQPIED
ncbi:MAG: LPS assembly protein LptD [Planctomycetaceae bacterium]|nr:LPS assembly protein LptD [Planctomycetaceae bacterium]